ncbi:MAG: cyclase family protein [Candidatus Bathyarchaeia archaeon]
MPDWTRIVDWSKVEIYDLSQPTSSRAPPFPTYPPFKVYWIKRLSDNRVNAQFIESPLHTGTHFDGQQHFITGGRDIASIPFDSLVGEGVIVDISDRVEDYDIYTKEMVLEATQEGGQQIKPNDILIINTGYHRHAWCGENPDEVKYNVKHPGPDVRFARWVIEMRFKWLGVDAVSQDHPLNTVIRNVRPDLVREAEGKWGRKIDELLPWPENYQVMHAALFPHEILHAENLGGEIDKILNKRCIIGCFPFKFEGGESAFARIVAFSSR